MKKNSKIYVGLVALSLNVICITNHAFPQSDASRFWGLRPGNEQARSLQEVVIEPCEDHARFRVSFLNPEQKNVTINVSDGLDVDFHIQTKELQYDRIFNMEQLQDGKYHITIKAGHEVINKDIMVSTVIWDDRRILIAGSR
jgi:hypothetical protein